MWRIKHNSRKGSLLNGKLRTLCNNPDRKWGTCTSSLLRLYNINCLEECLFDVILTGSGSLRLLFAIMQEHNLSGEMAICRDPGRKWGTCTTGLLRLKNILCLERIVVVVTLARSGLFNFLFSMTQEHPLSGGMSSGCDTGGKWVLEPPVCSDSIHPLSSWVIALEPSFVNDLIEFFVRSL